MQRSLSTLHKLVSFVAIAFAFLFPHFGIIPLPFAYAIPVLLITWVVLKMSEENFRTIGFSLQNFEIKAVWLGAVAAVVLFSFLNYVFFPLLGKVLPLHKANLDDYKFVRHHFLHYLFILLMGWVIGGWYEELIFHGFVYTRFEKMIKGKYAGTIVFVLTNIIFGLYHLQLGLSGMINAFCAGCAYQALMLRFRRNAWYAIFFHGFFDTIALTFIYLGFW